MSIETSSSCTVGPANPDPPPIPAERPAWERVPCAICGQFWPSCGGFQGLSGMGHDFVPAKRLPTAYRAAQQPAEPVADLRTELLAVFESQNSDDNWQADIDGIITLFARRPDAPSATPEPDPVGVLRDEIAGTVAAGQAGSHATCADAILALLPAHPAALAKLAKGGGA